jgi:hypothetical protein
MIQNPMVAMNEFIHLIHCTHSGHKLTPEGDTQFFFVPV